MANLTISFGTLAESYSISSADITRVLAAYDAANKNADGSAKTSAELFRIICDGVAQGLADTGTAFARAAAATSAAAAIAPVALPHV